MSVCPCLDFFSASFSLTDAAQVLSVAALSVSKKDNELTARCDNGSEILISLDQGPWVRLAPAAIGANSPYANAMRNCDARSAITFDSLDEVLAERNTTITAQTYLLVAAQGYVFNTWNGALFDSCA